MTNSIIYSIRHDTLNKFYTPFICDNNQEAIIKVYNMVSTNPFIKDNIKDYSILIIGNFDHDTGQFTEENNIINLDKFIISDFRIEEDLTDEK